MPERKVFVAMSGGVDSSVSAALLKEQGHAIEGVTMCFELPESGKPGQASCCGVESIQAARTVCRALGISHHVLNYGDVLEELVIGNFVDEYARGRTPNPCVRCNTYMKFDRLFRDVQELGGTYLATGHYAIVEKLPRGHVLKKGIDPRKDQSYFLYGIRREVLPFIMFPLGGFEKPRVRAMAAERGLPVAHRPDSQDICFVPDGNYRRVVADRLGGTADALGDIVDETGRVVGSHSGLSNFTVGQREGLGIALGRVVYVTALDAVRNRVHVGPRELTLSRGLEASGLVLSGMDFSQEMFEAGVKIRYNHVDIPARVHLLDHNRVRVEFQTPQSSVTPGQSVVFYDRDVVLGGALIDRPLPAA